MRVKGRQYWTWTVVFTDLGRDHDRWHIFHERRGRPVMLLTREVARLKCREIRKERPSYRTRVASLSYSAEF